MTVFFRGWLGYGTAVQAGNLTEPADATYMRRSYILGDMDNGIVSDVGGGTVGPAGSSWGTIGYAALFDAQSGGNLLLWLPLPLPILVISGGTITTSTGANRFRFPDLQGGHRNTFVWPAGGVVAWTTDGRVLTAGVPLQVISGQLAAQTAAFGITVTMPSLPATQPQAGAGQLWNNGGIISVS